MTIAPLRRTMLRWYRRHGRDLPWRRTKDPYPILVSEVMLQQTQVDRVVPKFEAFILRFPTVRALAAAPLAEVLRVWSGLGYNGRARRLWECARVVVRSHGGRFPREVAALGQLPGVGPYTAGALASFAFGAREACVDTNIRRVLSRAIDGRDRRDADRAWELARAALPRGTAGEWHQALMDIGALYCRPKPRCDACPIRRHCAGAGKAARREAATPPRRTTAYAGSRRFYRGKIVKALARSRAMDFVTLGAEVAPGFEKSRLPWLKELLDELEREGLITIDRRRATARLG